MSQFPSYDPDRSELVPAEPSNAELAAGPAPQPPVPPPGYLVGQVTSLSSRGETFARNQAMYVGGTYTSVPGAPGLLNIVNFRLVGPFGPPVEVEMRGTRFDGMVRDGDWVQIQDRRDRNGRLTPKMINNLTTRSLVTVTGGPGTGSRVAIGCMLAFIAVLIVIVALGITVVLV